MKRQEGFEICYIFQLSDLQFQMQQKARKYVVSEYLRAICVPRCEGLEPPTYWFVASHSIQLS